MSFADQVHELGGDQADIDLLKDVASDEEYYETNDAPRDKALGDDVASMWAELQGKPKKIVFEDNEPKKTKVEPKKDSKSALKEEKLAKDTKKEKDTKKVEEPKTRKEKEPKARKEKAIKPEPKSLKNAAAPAKSLSSIVHPGTLLVNEETDVWGTEAPAGKKLPADQIEFYKQKAEQLLRTENDLYEVKMKKDPEHRTQVQFLKSGTFGDQLGTLSLVITPSPLHNIRAFDALLNKCEIKNRESACKALEVTKDLLCSHVLPDRRLRHFKDQPLTIQVTAEQLIAYAFEDYLKDFYFKLLQIMERLLGDSVENIRVRTLHCLFGFFEAKPEQEQNLLRLGLNKLGDNSGKVASRVKKLLLDTFVSHPGMKSIAAQIISETLERSTEYRLRYYATDTLSEFILSSREPKLANQLLYIYLNLFERLLAEWDTKDDVKEEKQSQDKKGRNKKRGKKGGLVQQAKSALQVEDEQNARLVSKIFSGLNRAFPFSEVDASAFSKYMDTLYRMSHSPNAATYIEALSFIFQLSQNSDQGMDRYYRALYESLIDQRLYTSSKISKYLSLVLKSVSKDTNNNRSCAYAKRILQSAIQWPETGAVAALAHIVNYINPEFEGGDESYNLKARDPKFAKAETSKLWEIVPLLNHYHPTVTVYAENILSDEKQALDMPDIEQHTVNSFLTKWSYKKPKEKDNTRGGSIFQPLSGYTDLAIGVKQESRGSQVPISVQDWQHRKRSDVRPDEQFYYEYFKDKVRAPKKSEDVDSDLEEDEIFNAIMKSNPDELPSDDELDLEMDDEDLAELEGMSDDLDDEDLGDLDNMSDFSSDGEVAPVQDNSDEEDDGEDDEDEDEEDDDADEGDFAKFGEDDSESEAEVTEKPKKRKREWQAMPTFMDADAYEEYSKRPKS